MSKYGLRAHLSYFLPLNAACSGDISYKFSKRLHGCSKKRIDYFVPNILHVVSKPTASSLGSSIGMSHPQFSACLQMAQSTHVFEYIQQWSQFC